MYCSILIHLGVVVFQKNSINFINETVSHAALYLGLQINMNTLQSPDTCSANVRISFSEGAMFFENEQL